MSRNSWSSTGSDAEVRHHFDQPFDYDPRRYLDQLNSSASRDSIVDDEAEASDDGTQFDFSRQSHDSFEAVSDHPPDEDTSNLPPASDYLDDTHDQSNQAICRICLESSSNDAAGGESLGRLLSPCRCKGTMKYVHATCLDQWRAASARSSSAVACDQCGAPYRFRKSKFVGLATSPTLLFVVSLFLFLLLIWTVGVVATFCMDLYDRPTAIKTSPKAKSRSWWPWRSAYDNYDADLMPLQNDAWSYLDADYSTPGMWSYSTLMYEPAAYVKLIKEAVRSFASGEAVDAVREVVGLQDSGEAQQAVQDDLQEECGFWSALKHEWMYGDGGLWQRSASSSSSSPAQIAQDAGSSGSNADTSRSSPPKERSRERYDARAASDANDVDAIRRRRERSAKKARRTNQGQPAPQGWLSKLFVQCKFIALFPLRMGTPLTFSFAPFYILLFLLHYSFGRILPGRHPLLRQPPRWRLISGSNQPAQLWPRPLVRTHDFGRPRSQRQPGRRQHRLDPHRAARPHRRRTRAARRVQAGAQGRKERTQPARSGHCGLERRRRWSRRCRGCRHSNRRQSWRRGAPRSCSASFCARTRRLEMHESIRSTRWSEIFIGASISDCRVRPCDLRKCDRARTLTSEGDARFPEFRCADGEMDAMQAK